MEKNAYNVLIVDDDPSVLRIVTHILEAAGYCVDQACDGLQALAAIERKCPDFLITDWQMPQMNGLELCREIRGRTLPQYVYTFFVTARSDSEDLILGLEAGADDFLTKPVKHEVLLARLHAGERVLALERQLSALASTDSLTGLLSKRAFLPQLENEWCRAKRYQLPLSCVMLDADFFKRVNDTYGHPAGDKVLSAVASLLREDSRLSDILCRYGGEEFVILLPETDEESATLWAERVRVRVAELGFRFGDRCAGITASFGVAERNSEVQSGEDLLALADQALISAKQSGRDRVVSHSALDRAKISPSSGADFDYQRLFKTTTAAEVMTTFLAPLREADSVEQAAAHFLRSRFSSAPVVNGAGEMSGIVSEKDLLGLMRTPQAWTKPLHEVMKRNVVCYDLETPLSVIYEFLCRVAIRQVIIVREKRPIGMINQMSLVGWFNNWIYSQRPGRECHQSLQADQTSTQAAVLTTAEQLHSASEGFLRAVQQGPPELVPLLIAAASRMQEKLSDILSLSRHVNELSQLELAEPCSSAE